VSGARLRALDRSQDAEAVSDGASGDVGGVGERFELVGHAGPEVELDGHTGEAEALGVGEILIAEDVELTDLDVAGGRPERSVARAGAAKGGTSGPPMALPSSAPQPVMLSS